MASIKYLCACLFTFLIITLAQCNAAPGVTSSISEGLNLKSDNLDRIPDLDKEGDNVDEDKDIDEAVMLELARILFDLASETDLQTTPNDSTQDEEDVIVKSDSSSDYASANPESDMSAEKRNPEAELLKKIRDLRRKALAEQHNKKLKKTLYRLLVRM